MKKKGKMCRGCGVERVPGLRRCVQCGTEYPRVKVEKVVVIVSILIIIRVYIFLG